jgi:hypothetical protein
LKRVFAARQFATAIVTLGVMSVSVCELNAQEPAFPVTGSLLGTVVDSAGIPQMGASVELLNKYQKLLGKTMTAADGRFAFHSLSADNYSIHVSLDSFLPAARNQVAVKVGFDSILEVRLATLLSSVEVRYRVPTAAMSDEWKWVLRSSPSTRPVNRLTPVEDQPSPEIKPRVFSGTHAMLSVSGSDSGLIDSNDLAGDMGTSFAVSTRVMGNNQFQVAGTVGQNPQFGPSAVALSAVYSRADDSPFAPMPEITLAMLQLGGFGSAFSNTANGPSAGNVQQPMLRAMSLGIYQVTDPADNVHVEYGVKGETVEYGQHISRLSPYARITVGVAEGTNVIASFSDGGRPDALLAHQEYQQAEIEGHPDDLSSPVASISKLPEVSTHNNQLALQRTQNVELGVSKTVGSRTYAFSGFYEKVWNGQLNVAGDTSMIGGGDLFSDGLSVTSIYNQGHYNRPGYLASMSQRVNSSLNFGLAYGRMGGFTADPGAFVSGDKMPGGFLEQKQSNLASVNMGARLPCTGTRISAGYGWIDQNTTVPMHIFTTQSVFAMPGLNISLRQPLPPIMGMPGHFELTADVRNLLASGYMPVNMADGRQMLVVEIPRAIRGGLRITF